MGPASPGFDRHGDWTWVLHTAEGQPPGQDQPRCWCTEPGGIPWPAGLHSLLARPLVVAAARRSWRRSPSEQTMAAAASRCRPSFVSLSVLRSWEGLGRCEAPPPSRGAVNQG